MAAGSEVDFHQRVIADSAQVNRAAIILAAGASSRMGQPKALLEYRGETFLDRLIGLFEARCSTVVVVLGYHAEAIRKGVRRVARFVVNPYPERGMLSSLQTGLAALPAECESFFFTPVDYPAISAATVARLAESQAAVAIPRFAGKRGHPVLCRRELATEFLACADKASDVIHAHIAETEYIEVDDAGILTDVDDAEAYARLLAR